MKKLKYILITLLITTCNGTSQTKQTVNNKAKNTPEVKQMLSDFNKQKHRLGFNACEMMYNNKPFKLGMTIKELVEVFGEYDDFHRGGFIWKNIGIVCSSDSTEKNINSKLLSIYIYMNTEVSDDYKESLKHKLNTKHDYFLIEGMPVNKDMMFKDFINNSNFILKDFAVDNHGYELNRECNNSIVKSKYWFNVGGGWIYKGSGHLMTKSHTNKNNKNKIEYFNVE